VEPLQANPSADLDPATAAIRLVDDVLAAAVRDRASDIHFEPFEADFRIRRRVEGALHEVARPPLAWAQPITSRLKAMANANIAERRLPQDGRIRLEAGGRAADLRLSTLPTQHGESVVLRVLDRSGDRLGLDQLGLPPAVHDGLAAALRRPHGLVVVTGPTGSGKTTTLYGCLRELNDPEAKLLSVEDPVEFEIDGIMQVPVNAAAGLTFARALRAFLRQDPDVVMVGEVRDEETARIAIQAALTGHLVLATLHTVDAPSAVTRLVDMGIEPFLLASSLEAVVAQRLLRRNCPGCRREELPDEGTRRALGLGPEAATAGPFQQGGGCPQCGGTGYKGRLGLFEFLAFDDHLRECVARGAPLVELRRQAQAGGMITLREAGLAALRAGDTSVEEVLKYT
jgi:type IV pilus assembly protein PilB